MDLARTVFVVVFLFLKGWDSQKKYNLVKSFDKLFKYL